jgi:hypothetical protein
MRVSPAPWRVKLLSNLGYRFYANHLSRFYNCDWITGWAGEPVRPREELVQVTVGA